jgi:hypothetical protein
MWRICGGSSEPHYACAITRPGSYEPGFSNRESMLSPPQNDNTVSHSGQSAGSMTNRLTFMSSLSSDTANAEAM